MQENVSERDPFPKQNTEDSHLQGNKKAAKEVAFRRETQRKVICIWRARSIRFPLSKVEPLEGSQLDRHSDELLSNLLASP